MKMLENIREIGKDQLQNMIFEILESNSGGIKFIELIGFISAKCAEDGWSIPNLFQITEAIEEHEKIEILKYTWLRMNREKWFVHTP